MVEEETFVSLELVPPISVISPWCFQASFKSVAKFHFY